MNEKLNHLLTLNGSDLLMLFIVIFKSAFEGFVRNRIVI